jgi:hypothetical protein
MVILGCGKGVVSLSLDVPLIVDLVDKISGLLHKISYHISCVIHYVMINVVIDGHVIKGMIPNLHPCSCCRTVGKVIPVLCHSEVRFELGEESIVELLEY